jgi:hypothetical protein
MIDVHKDARGPFLVRPLIARLSASFSASEKDTGSAYNPLLEPKYANSLAKKIIKTSLLKGL